MDQKQTANYLRLFAMVMNVLAFKVCNFDHLKIRDRTTFILDSLLALVSLKYIAIVSRCSRTGITVILHFRQGV